MRSAHFLSAVLMLLVVVAGAGVARASQACELDVDDIESAEWDELVDALVAPECATIADALAARLDRLIDDPQRPADVDADEMIGIQFALLSMRLRKALWQQDIALARQLLGQGRDLESRARSSAYVSGAGWEEAELEILTKAGDRMLAVLDEAHAAAALQPIKQPEPEWTIAFGWCGTPAVSFNMTATLATDRADALVAIGKPEIGLQILLSEQWMDAMSLGMAPPRMRAFAERALGPQRYEAEIEAALAGIRIEQTPGGRIAHLPLFGLWLPVPLATRSWNDPQPLRFESAADIANYLRPQLLRSPH